MLTCQGIIAGLPAMGRKAAPALEGY